MSQQITMLENDTYAAFVEKFKPKKTTDDCYTPPLVYEAVLGWVVDHYGINTGKVDRPFWPGGDYERFSYTKGGCVVDNPPFSLLAEIIDFYNENNIKYFLFAPYLTNFASAHKCCHIITPQTVTYENGAQVATAFVTNLDDRLIVGDVDLFKRLEKAEKGNNKKATLPRYTYPDNIIMTTDVGYMVKYGVNFEVKKEDAIFIRELESQKAHGKSLFGGGFLCSEKIAEKRRQADRQAEENRRQADRQAEENRRQAEGVYVWELSERERLVIEHLNREGKNNGNT